MNPLNPNSHLTAKERTAPSLPVKMLYDRYLLEGKVLDYGCGLGADVSFMRSRSINATGYDPHYQPQLPQQRFDTILCFYVLNVLMPDEQCEVLMNISRLLSPTGRAYFAVRRDIKKDGFRNHFVFNKQVYQCNVILPFKSIFQSDNAELYEYVHYNQLRHASSSCPFCKPKPELKLIAETACSYAVLDGFAVSKGHALIIPKAHCTNFFDLPINQQQDLLALAGYVQKRLKQRYAPDGFTVGFNIGVAAGQRFDHSCLHLIPRYKGDVANPSGGIRNILKR